jgi:predicted transcriptional regulator
MRYRPTNEIRLQVLEACNREGGILKTHLMYRAGLSFVQLDSYIHNAIESKLIELKKNKYHITDKGRQTMGILKMMNEMVAPKKKK